jgi:TRAP-type C4-dicarboxylate transport system permease small subunit
MKLSAIDRVIERRIIRPISFIGVTVLVLFMLLTVSDVIARYVFNHPILGTMELIKTSMVVLSFLVLGWTTYDKGHVRLDFVITRFSTKVQRGSEFVHTILALFFAAFMTYSFVVETIHRLHTFEQTPSLKIPVFAVYIVADLGLAITCLVLVAQLLASISRRAGGPHES